MVLETNRWRIEAKDEERVAWSHKMQQWGKPTASYLWGQSSVSVQPETGAAGHGPIFFTIEDEVETVEEGEEEENDEAILNTCCMAFLHSRSTCWGLEISSKGF